MASKQHLTINDLVNEALLRWAALLGLDVGDGAEKTPLGARVLGASYETERQLTELNESREMDPTGLTTFMMLRALVEAFLNRISFTAYTLILEPASCAEQLTRMKALRDVLEDPQVLDLIRTYKSSLLDAALHYGVRPGGPMDALTELLEDKHALAHIRRDALLSLKRLEPHQFTQGKPDPEPLKYNPQVYEFWNVNSLVAAMRAQRVAGISMVLIRDPELPLRSYFVYAIRNGGTITVLTDRSKEPHPAYKRMTRRPDREMNQRASQNWFPYDLLDVSDRLDELGQVKQTFVRARTQLVPMNVEAVPLKDVRDLKPEQFVWAVLMFDLIRDKYWKQDFRTPELSYTGQMVVDPAALVGKEGALVREGLYKPLELPVLKKEDVTAESTADQWEDEVSGFNQWIVERYGARVPEEVLNPIGAEAKALLVAKSSDPSFLPVQVERSTGAIQKVDFETLDPTMFGRKEQIQRDRVWVGRVNQMKAIQRLADEEYAKEREGVLAWFRDRLKENREFILDAAARGSLLLPAHHARRMHEPPPVGDVRMDETLVQKVGDSWYKANLDFYASTPSFLVGPAPQQNSRSFCAERPNTLASVFTSINPSCPEALATLAGCTVKELPWPLQHWYRTAPYMGNNIINRLDPEDWVLRNPWMPHTHGKPGILITVGVALCKPAINARRKRLGLPRKQWGGDDDTDE